MSGPTIGRSRRRRREDRGGGGSVPTKREQLCPKRCRCRRGERGRSSRQHGRGVRASVTATEHIVCCRGWHRTALATHPCNEGRLLCELPLGLGGLVGVRLLEGRHLHRPVVPGPVGAGHAGGLLRHRVRGGDGGGRAVDVGPVRLVAARVRVRWGARAADRAFERLRSSWISRLFDSEDGCQE